jgi:hypothetical protein
VRSALGVVVLALATALAGCAGRVPVPTNRPAEASAIRGDAAEPAAPRDEVDTRAALDAARVALAAAEDEEGDEGVSFSVEAIHRARIAMAREALVEENAMKQRIDVEEQLQRELEALSDRPAKSHVPPRRARPKVDRAGAGVGSRAVQPVTRPTATP